MFVIILLVLNVLMLFFTFSSFSDKKRIFAPLAEAISVFLCLYIVTSAAMWLFESFSVEFCLLAVTVLNAIVFTVRYFKSDIKGKEFFALDAVKIDYRVFLNKIAILVAVFLSLGAYSTFGVGFNDGNSQTLAISILNGNNSRRFTIDEYDYIQPESKYENFFFDTISNLDTENFTADYWISDEGSVDGQAKMWVDFGANPIYPSILALSATIFGISRMAYIQALFAFCLFVFVDEILKALKCDWKLRSILVLLLGVSPVIIYCNHTTLVEPVIGFCMVLFIYFLLCKEDKLQVISALGVIAFAFLHTSVYTMLPLFLVISWMYFIHARKVRYLIASIIAVSGYAFSFAFLNIFAYENTSINYRLGMPFLKDNNFIFVIIIVALAVLVAIPLLIVSHKTDAEKIGNFERTKGKLIFKIGIIVVTVASIVLMIVTNIIKCDSFKDTLNITFIAFAVCSGLLLMPYIIGRLLSASYPVGIKEAVIVVSFVYTILFYSSVMKIQLDGYYYEARYLSSFIPFVILAAGLMLRLLKAEEKYIIPIIGIIMLLTPYSIALLSPKAENRMDWSIVENVLNEVEDNADERTVVLVEKSLIPYFYFPLLNKTDARVYPFETSYINDFIFDTKDASSKVLFITDSNGISYKYRGGIKFFESNARNEVSEDDLSLIVGLPNGFHESTSDVVQVIEVSNLGKMADFDSLDTFEMNNIKFTIEDIEIDDENKAHVTVSLTDGKKLYYNEDLLLSYHLEYEEADDIYDNARTNIGAVAFGDYSFDFDLSELDENMTVVIDVVEEGVEWYSWKRKAPVIEFFKGENGWEYEISAKRTR